MTAAVSLAAGLRWGAIGGRLSLPRRVTYLFLVEID
jgi:hypothetical protein